MAADGDVLPVPIQYHQGTFHKVHLQSPSRQSEFCLHPHRQTSMFDDGDVIIRNIAVDMYRKNSAIEEVELTDIISAANLEPDFQENIFAMLYINNKLSVWRIEQILI